jgi:hypothetical protein
MGRFLLGGLCSVGLLLANAGCGSDSSAPTPVPTLADRPTTSSSLDIEIKTLQSFAAPADFGKKYPVTFTLRCA